MDKTKKKKILKETALYLGVFIFSFLLFSFVIKTAVVDGDSMNDTYKNGDVLVCMRNMLPEKEDVIVCNSNAGIVLVKRVIGTAGDEIDIDFEKGIVKVNGEVLDEPYIKEPTSLNRGAFEYPITVPEDCYFVMGDNRNRSDDSRSPQIGYIKKDQIIGTVLFRILKG